jgi:hypothetical protein
MSDAELEKMLRKLCAGHTVSHERYVCGVCVGAELLRLRAENERMTESNTAKQGNVDYLLRKVNETLGEKAVLAAKIEAVRALAEKWSAVERGELLRILA